MPPTGPPPATRPAAIFAQPASFPTSAYARHQAASAASVALYGGSVPVPTAPRTERDILEAHHRFLREDSPSATPTDEERALAKRYYDKLYKDTAVVELGRWRERLVALRWRTREEVLAGKGERVCARLGCERGAEDENEEGEDGGTGRRKSLREFEMNFEYREEGRTKNALVKVRVCRRCAKKLEYTQRKERRRSRSPSRSRERKEKRRGRSEEESKSTEDVGRRKSGDRRHRHRTRDGDEPPGDNAAVEGMVAAEDKAGRRRRSRHSRSRSPSEKSRDRHHRRRSRSHER